MHRPYPQAPIQHHQQYQHPQMYQQQQTPHQSSRRGIGPMLGAPPHQQQPTQAQMQAQHEAQRAAMDAAKRRSRKPTDKNIPEGVEECIIGEGVQRYRQLREVERKLDASMMRKRLDIQSVHDSNVKIYRTLRIWISNTVEDQPWQTDALDVNSFDFSANTDASYRVKIEGRLLDDDLDNDLSEDEDGVSDFDAMDEDSKVPKKIKPLKPSEKYRFSHFFKSMTVDYEKTRNKDENVEWKKPIAAANSAPSDVDQICFKRDGDENVNITFNLTRDEAPEIFTLSPALEEVMDCKEATRAEVVTGIWEYIKLMELQEDDEKRSFRCDDLLKKIFLRDNCQIPAIPELISPHFTPLPPLRLAYTIRCDQEFHKDPKPTVYDVRVTIADPLSTHLQHFNNSPTLPSTLREISTLNEQLALYIQRIGESKAKHDFLTAMTKDPAVFIQKWMSSQKRDLEVIMGEASRGGGDDANGELFRKGGKDSVWGSQHVKETVNLLLSARRT